MILKRKLNRKCAVSRITAAVLSVLMVVLSVFGVDGLTIKAKAADEVTLKIHYHRYDENYDNWTLWLWKLGGDGNVYEFTEEDDYGKVCTAVFDNMGSVEQIGLIARLGEWEKKDVDSDRFIDVSAGPGVYEIYLLEGEETIYTDAGAIDLSPVIRSAYFPTSKKMNVTVTQPLDTTDETDTSAYHVTDASGTEYQIKKIWTETPGMNSSIVIVMEEYLDMGKTYTLSIDGYGEKRIAVENAFSEKEFEDAYTYTGDDLGCTYSAEKASFRLWAPTADGVTLCLYEAGDGDNKISETPMTQDVNGTWVAELSGDQNGLYYTYAVNIGGMIQEGVDPYARTTGVNGKRAMIINLEATNPYNWDKDNGPVLESPTDAVIYELHVRDLGSDANSGITNVGKFLSLTETGTKNSDGLATGLDHIKELGVTHIHFLPIFDYASVDEASTSAQFNWGYDPENFNVPEGSYSTDPFHGEVRVAEMKEMVQTLHDNNIGVIMDVVYNHTFNASDSCLNICVPDYYYRKSGTDFTNGSGCGNELATERAMVRKYIVDSVVYWATQYHIDGFRFDLMGLYDIDTMNEIRAALDAIDPSIMMYGEGWTGGTSALPTSSAAVKANTKKLDNIASFSDDLRDSLKGHVFTDTAKGFVSGAADMEEGIKFGVVGATDNSNVLFSIAWANSPAQCINYASAHDNLTLWDKLATSNPDSTVEDRIRMNMLSAAIVLTSQGVPFFQAGEELLRSKTNADGTFNENSYNSNDAVNGIKWDEKTTNLAVFEYYKGLIAFRKAHALLRMQTTEEVTANLVFQKGTQDNVVAYTITDTQDSKGEKIMVIYNANPDSVTMELPEGKWNVYVNGETAGTKVIETLTKSVTVDGISAIVLVQEGKSYKAPKTTLFIAIGACCVAIIGAIAALIIKRGKKQK